MIPAFAESPSQNIIVHSADFEVPAQLASISLGIPRIFFALFPSVFLAALVSFISLIAHAESATPILAILSIHLSEIVQLEPNLLEVLLEPMLLNEEVDLSYCQSNRVNENGFVTGSWINYTDDIHRTMFLTNFIINGNDFNKFDSFKIDNKKIITFLKSLIQKNIHFQLIFFHK